MTSIAADINQTRMDTHNRWLTAAGQRPVPTYDAGDVATMLAPRSASPTCSI